MENLLISFFAGAAGGVLSWFLTDFLKKPFRAFFDLKREGAEILARYSNVKARSNQDGTTRVEPLGEPEEKRLMEAEAALRDHGAKLIAYSQTERLALPLLKQFGYDPAKIGRHFIGLSNSISQYGNHRHHFRELLEKSLKLKP